MSKNAAILNEREEAPTKVLYHYTTQAGLLGILNNDCLWASHMRYLNDVTDGQVFLKIFAAVIDIYGRLDPTAPGRKHLTQLRSNVRKLIDSQNSFVSSFSQQGDRLSQWRAYGGSAGGYSVGFRRDYLQNLGIRFLESRDAEFYKDPRPLLQCHYLPSDLLAGSRRKSKPGALPKVDPLWRHEFSPIISGTGSAEERTDTFVLDILKAAAFYKHEGFAEEEEWRIAFLRREGEPSAGMKFRAGRSMPIPYFEIDFNLCKAPPGIEEVVVGPCPHASQSIKSIRLLLDSKGLRKVKVVPSKIPYRNW